MDNSNNVIRLVDKAPVEPETNQIELQLKIDSRKFVNKNLRSYIIVAVDADGDATMYHSVNELPALISLLGALDIAKHELVSGVRVK